MSTNSVSDCDVVVVGTGPMGGYRGPGARHLWRAGARGVQWHWLANTPRAHITNQRAMEVLRDLGVEEEAKQYAIPVGADRRHDVRHELRPAPRSLGCRPGARGMTGTATTCRAARAR